MVGPNTGRMAAKIEPFDSFWEGPEDIEKGYYSFYQFYRRNYLPYLPKYKNATILVVSCGPGYFLNLLQKEGYTDISGIDSHPGKVSYARAKGLRCECTPAFAFFQRHKTPYDAIVAEQEINHLTKEEISQFLTLAWNNLREGGILILHSLNGANPITASEALAQNFDHFNTLTEYSLRQILHHHNFEAIRVFPLNLFVFYKNPVNYMAIFIDKLLTCLFKLSFKFYGKSNRFFTKKIAAISKKPFLP